MMRRLAEVLVVRTAVAEGFFGATFAVDVVDVDVVVGLEPPVPLFGTFAE
jgi:hypothetical protein